MLMEHTHAFLSYDDNTDCNEDDCNPGIANDDYAAVDDDEAHYDGDHHGHGQDNQFKSIKVSSALKTSGKTPHTTG